MMREYVTIQGACGRVSYPVPVINIRIKQKCRHMDEPIHVYPNAFLVWANDLPVLVPVYLV